MRCSCTHITISKGRRQNRKSRKFGTMSQIGLTPPPSDLWDIFEFGTFLKNVDQPPLLPNWDIFEFLTFSKNADPPPLCQIRTFF